MIRIPSVIGNTARERLVAADVSSPLRPGALKELFGRQRAGGWTYDPIHDRFLVMKVGESIVAQPLLPTTT